MLVTIIQNYRSLISEYRVNLHTRAIGRVPNAAGEAGSILRNEGVYTVDPRVPGLADEHQCLPQHE